MLDGIRVRGAREHNLKNVSLEIPRNQITVVTGLSGSGKSSLAFDIIYAEGQRRYVESLSSYARQFMDQLKKPEVESVTGLSPAIAIDQRGLSTNPRSTVGTVTEIHDYLRLLYAKVGQPKCPIHQIPVSSQTPQQIIEDIFKLPQGTKFMVLAPVAQGKKGEFLREFQKWGQKGFVRARVDGDWMELSQPKKLAKRKAHDIDLMVDRLMVQEKYRHRLSESLNLSLSLAQGQVTIQPLGKLARTYSIHNACPECGFSFPELEPRLFSFNNPKGACPTCAGMGLLQEEEGDWGESEDGNPSGAHQVCPDCKGARLCPEAMNVVIDGHTIAELSSLAASELRQTLSGLKLTSRHQMLASKIVQQIEARLHFMDRVGTAYLSLDRRTMTLSGGEAQRIRLATQVGSSLVGVLYVLDEPSIGLHPRDHYRLLHVLREIRNRGNTILMVEHDEETIRTADYIVDLGPGAGSQGGQVMAQGKPEAVSNDPASLTGQYLSGKLQVPLPAQRRSGHGTYLELKGAKGNNLQNLDVRFPLGSLCGVTGVSGSGKSTLIVDTLYPILAKHFYKALKEPQPYESLSGLEHIDKVIEINQKPIGRTPRSTPATYTGLFPLVRDLYAQLPESKMRGHRPGYFSFNVKGGRCEVCQGAGQIRVEMHFLSDVFVECEACLGQRYNPEARNIRYRGKSIADVLNMTVSEAHEFFKNHLTIHRKLKTLMQVGLDYLTLGQSSTTLSGGEAQRIKLSRELSKRGTGKTFYILDEPTTGLHFEDVRKLVSLMQQLVDQGNTVLVIEHHLDIIKCCDYIIDLGPEGGALGGQVVAQGTPEEVAAISQSETGRFLKNLLN